MKSVPMRTCVICREKQKKSDLIRIVNNETEGVVADASGRMNGRGAYVCSGMDCIASPKARKALSAALKTNVTDEAYEAIVKKIERLVTKKPVERQIKIKAVAVTDNQ